MAAATQNDLVLELCCVPGRQEALDEMLVQLELCSKALQAGLGVLYMKGSSPSCALPGRLCASVKALALHLPQEMSSCSNTLKDLCFPPPLTQTLLQDYLETKRLAFPRFYFVAPADLLDILANASQPQAIVRLSSGHASPRSV